MGVDTSQCFTLYNQKHMYNNNPLSYLYLNLLDGFKSGNQLYAGLCSGCGNCIKICAQKLDVPLLLRDSIA